MAVPDPLCVDETTGRLLDLLKRARDIKASNAIDPALPASEFTGDLGLPPTDISKGSHSVSVEIAARRLFQGHVAASDIHSPEFVYIWNLLDILLICGDQEQCEPTLLWYLIEELLDSQSLGGCRVVFDYLESRRERLIAKNFTKVSLVILRACNELLRRLSRAEDAVFCGRVFIFLFQSFPLGDRSSVNRQGDYNSENVTIFDEQTAAEPAAVSVEDTAMVDVTASTDENADGSAAKRQDDKDNASTKSMTADELYPSFWNLQKSFALPTRVFEQPVLDEFKQGFEATLAKFKEVKIIQGATGDSQRGAKRKSDEMDDEFASSFNPKYLTSRELFQLELSDLAFQRHILVQALILLDFLLSLTEKAKKRLANRTQQKVNFTLSEQDTEWALKMKNSIYAALRDGENGPAFARVVETVLSRDKNWVRWKEENCPEILLPPVEPKDFSQAKDGAKSASAWRRIRATPLGSLDLTFLSDHSNGVTKPQDSARFLAPDAETLVKKIELDDLDLEWATTDEEKNALLAAKTAKTWRTLRIAGKTKLSLFHEVDDGKNLKVLFQANGTEHGSKSEDIPDGGGGGGDEGLGPASADKTGDEGSMEVRTTQATRLSAAEAS